MSNLLLRSISGSAYVAIVVCAVLLKNPAVYVAVFSLFALMGVWEYSRLVQNNRTRPIRSIVDGLAASYIFTITLFSGISGIDRILYVPYVAYLLYIFIRNLYTEGENGMTDLAKTILGQVYVAGGLSMANFIAFSSDSMTFADFNSPLLLSVFILIWVNDTGAYIVGSTLGRHKMAPKISPKKSWEGFVGGVVFAMICAMLLGHFWIRNGMDWYVWALVGGIAAVAATWGDLVESKLKRTAGVKDSGWIIPGHGGILDRIDSVLITLPFVYVMLLIINY